MHIKINKHFFSRTILIALHSEILCMLYVQEYILNINNKKIDNIILFNYFLLIHFLFY